jgi:Glu-tRNA(Gln) amidotransferase subunit E-like FAD-binding protein
MISKALNVLSLGKFGDVVKKQGLLGGYDKLFHLSLFINNKYIFHKIEVPTLEQANPIKQNSEVRSVQLTRTFTIGEFIDNTRKYMGDAKFSNYNAATNNCQVFITAALQANGLLTNSTNKISQFINQDAESIFKQLPQYVSNITNVITDIGARANRLIQGEGIPDKIAKKISGLTYKNVKYIKPQIALAKKYKIPVVSIKLSPLKNKKYMIELKDGRIIHYGHPSYEDFLIHKDPERRARFLNRWKTNKNIDNDNSALFYSVRLLW